MAAKACTLTRPCLCGSSCLAVPHPCDTASPRRNVVGVAALGSNQWQAVFGQYALKTFPEWKMRGDDGKNFSVQVATGN